MKNRRSGPRHVIAFPVRVNWQTEGGEKLMEEGLTENVGPQGALIFLPRLLPDVGSKVKLTVTEDPKNEISVSAEVLRLERNAAHPQAALRVTHRMKVWKEQVWSHAGEILAAEEPEVYEDW